jgi:UPF0755 protein
MSAVGRTILGVAIVLLAITGVVVNDAWHSVSEPFKAFTGDAVELQIDPGTSARNILVRLEAEGLIEDAFWTRLYLTRYLDDPSLKAGEYRFEGLQTAPEVLDKLIRSEVVTHEVTIIEGLDLGEIAHHLAVSGFGSENEFRRLMTQVGSISKLDPEATDLEGYLFPDTYAFARGTSEETIVNKLVATFLDHWQQEIMPLRGDEGTLSPRQLVTLASIVEKESGAESERAVVAGVYSNRLRIGMGLYADPTVIYALKKAGTYDGNVRKRDLEVDSPYNTYRRAGLPPGPICSPGLASLLAATQPEDVPYLYFVSRNDGTHVFARTLAEHNRNVQRWQKQYWRDEWARQRAAAESDS